MWFDKNKKENINLKYEIDGLPIVFTIDVNDSIQQKNIESICKQFERLINEIKCLKRDIDTLKIKNEVEKYEDIYDYLNKRSIYKHYIIKGNKSDEESVIKDLLAKTFGGIYTGNYWATPVCLMYIIEKCEEIQERNN